MNQVPIYNPSASKAPKLPLKQLTILIIALQLQAMNRPVKVMPKVRR